jgi:hypothetical protein
MNTSFERKSQEENWITPKYIIDELGKFDLDPCASYFQKQLYANTNWYIEDDSINKQWFGRVWCNPPYGNKTKDFIQKLSNHGNGIALIFARVDTKLWHDIIFPKADSIFILKGRIKFIDINGKESDSAGAPSALIAFGQQNKQILEKIKLKGVIINTKLVIK